MSIGAKNTVKLYVILRKAINGRYNNHIKGRVLTFLDEWRRRFAIIYGKEPEEIKFLKVKIEYPILFLYALHTYYAILVKCLGACIVGIYLGYDIALELIRKGLDTLREIEIEGKPFKQYGIVNLIEPDIYSWYLIDKDKSHETFEKELSEVIKDIGRILGTYNFKFIKPTRDILKRLYQNIIPREIRRALGEFYTPDWLAEYILDRVGFTGKIELQEWEEAKKKNDFSLIESMRLLDPACGSGTFIFHAILRVLNANKELIKKEPHLLAKAITNNIVGFDISPLAVITAKVTYLLALLPVLEHIGEVKIPIYETDSILVPEGVYATLYAEAVNISTPEGVITIPLEVIRNKNITFEQFFNDIEALLKREVSCDEVVDKYKVLNIPREHLKNVIENNVEVLEKLRTEGRDLIWLSIARNWVMPLILTEKQFSYIVGNPPWINLRNMPGCPERKACKNYPRGCSKCDKRGYREVIREIFNKYKLNPGGGATPRLEFATLFVYVSAYKFLRKGGKLGMLITVRVFQGAHGNLFRKFELPDGTPLKVIECHDMLKIRPFHVDVKNEPGAIILEKGDKTDVFKYIIWKGQRVSATDEWEPTLEEVMRKTRREEKLMRINIIKKDKKEEAIFIEKDKLICQTILGGNNPYAKTCHAGAQLSPREVYMLDESEVSFLPDGYARIKGKYLIESQFIYKSLKGEDIDRWLVRRIRYTPLAYTEQGFIGKNIYHTKLYKNYLNLSDVLTRLKECPSLYNISSELDYFKVMRAKNCLKYKIKVVWKDIANEFRAVVIENLIVVDDKTDYVGVNNPDEAHYICSILNSKLVNYCIGTIVPKELRPRVFRRLSIPKYDQNNPIHVLLSACSYLAHEFAHKSYHHGINLLTKYLRDIEEKINTLVEALYNLKSVDEAKIGKQILNIVREVQSKGILLNSDVVSKVNNLISKIIK